MGNLASNVTAGKPNISGAIYKAPLGTELPESTTDALTGFTCLGYVSEDGVSNDNSPESETIKAWGGNTVLALQTDRPDTFTYALIEALNSDVLEVVYGENNVEVDANGNIHVKATAEQLEAHAWVIDMVLRDGRAKRIVISEGTLTNLATIQYTDNDAVAYGITITATPDENGVYHHEYIAGESEISG